MSEIPPPTIPPATPPPPGGGSYTPPPPPTGGGYNPPPGGAGSDRTIMLVLSYLGLLALIPLLTKKEDREVQWHAKNGLAIFVAYIVVYILITVLMRFLPSGVGCGLSMLNCVLWLAYIALIVVCIVKATSGQRLKVPVISDFADKM
ncbi:MAG TPA: DUF4870 domain-containing protein [Thermoanaerobaculia bacterium]